MAEAIFFFAPGIGGQSIQEQREVIWIHLAGDGCETVGPYPAPGFFQGHQTWITTWPGGTWVGSVSNKHNPSAKSGLDAWLILKIPYKK